MNKLQKLFESNIPIIINNCPDMSDIENKRLAIFWQVGVQYTERFNSSFSNFFETAVDQIWEAAKKHYPDAECFKD